MKAKFLTRGLAVLLAAALLAVGSPMADAKAPTPTWSTGDLIAGQNEKIGTVTVVQSNGDIVVTFTITDTDWCLDKTHVYVGTDRPDKSAPGQFPYAHDAPDSCTSDVFTIDLDDFDCSGSTTLYVAAHADVVTGDECGFQTDLEAFCSDLPTGLVTVAMTRPSGRTSYFVATVSGGSTIDGVYEAWCIDASKGASMAYSAEVICSYAAGFDLVDFPENMDLVNYVLNLGYVGTVASDDTVFTYGDVQRAIWELIDDRLAVGGLGPWSQDRVDEIVDDAYANGEGYTPDCGEYMAVALNPVTVLGGSTVAQPVIVLLQLPCEPCDRDETAWGWGTESWDTGWGRYRTFTAVCPTGD